MLSVMNLIHDLTMQRQRWGGERVVEHLLMLGVNFQDKFSDYKHWTVYKKKFIDSE